MTLRVSVVLAGCTVVAISNGALAIESASVSPDVTVALSGTIVSDEDVAVDNLLGVVVPASLGNLPDNAALTAYHLLGNGDQLFALDTSVELPGPLIVQRRDVVRFDGASYTLEFDGSAAGVPDGAAVDAVSLTGLGLLLLSFDTTVEVGTVIAADEDVVGWDGATFALAVDASTLGVPEAVDTDAIHDPQDGNGMLSFDVGNSVGGVDFADEDMLIFDFGTSMWTVAYDGSAQHPALAPADVEAFALPEPGGRLGLLVGMAGVFGLHRRRTRVRRRATSRG